METEDECVDANSNMTGKLVDSLSADEDSILEEVVEEGQILMQDVDDHQQVVMLTGGEMGQQHIVITDGNLPPGAQVIQLPDGNHSIVMNSRVMKTEPEDLSVREERGMVRLPGNRQINLEAGAQAIQASAAACVQNVIRNLNMKDTEKISIITGTGGPASQERVDHVLIEDSLLDSMHESPAKRTRTTGHDHPKLTIAKQYSPFGFHCTLEAPTAQWVRRDEDRCTYMNKGQFYGVTLEYRANPAEPITESLVNVRSVVMLVFRDAKNPDDELNAWEFWHGRQPTSKQRIIDAETNNMSDQVGITEIEDVAYNAIAVYWNPLEKPAFLSIALQCLSTDFSLQKGVKGLPMHLQIDTYAKSGNDGDYDIIHRAYCQVKVFCDKGAERKFRQEERRAAKKVAVGGQRVLDMYCYGSHCIYINTKFNVVFVQDRSDFYSMVDLSRIPVLYIPSSSDTPPLHSVLGGLGVSPSNPTPPGLSLLKNSTVIPERRRKSFPPPETRMVVYVRQENEEIYTPLHLVPPTVPGLARAIETKYNVSATAIRYLYRRNSKGIIAKLDDDLLKFYCNEDTFLMQVTAIELEGVAGQESIMYDITLCEIND
ncbi:protein grainyhead [Eurytemora carolleeae]|uniref:protein grainyhead n=1 Tax=Eurytemora carolleeae TaxID=1294199 RepID=UPI000C76E8A5|nr:protein grainyhead [Eurytemora carolleeae]|eukprot:XP_023323982.1 protein grainyhead-like [Eurytemora affinis]